MKFKRFYSILSACLPLCLSALLMSGCVSDPECHQLQKIRAGMVVDSKLDTLTLTGIANDSVLYRNAPGGRTLQLPLRPDTNVTAYKLEWHEQLDTLFIRHINDYRYISFACGCYVYFVIDSAWATHHFVDTFAILDSDVSDQTTDNLILTAQP